MRMGSRSDLRSGFSRPSASRKSLANSSWDMLSVYHGHGLLPQFNTQPNKTLRKVLWPQVPPPPCTSSWNLHMFINRINYRPVGACYYLLLDWEHLYHVRIKYSPLKMWQTSICTRLLLSYEAWKVFLPFSCCALLIMSGVDRVKGYIFYQNPPQNHDHCFFVKCHVVSSSAVNAAYNNGIYFWAGSHCQ